MRQGRVHESMGSSRAGLSAETRARVAPIARGNPAPAAHRLKSRARQNRAQPWGGSGAGRVRARIARGRQEARVAARFRSPTTRSASNEDIDARTRTHGDGDGGRLLGELNTLHTSLGHDLHGAGLGGGAGGAGRGGGADGGDERNLGDSHFSCLRSCVYENGGRVGEEP
jgi:hypothetical protein